jgi:ferrous iron transport protein A
MLSLADLEPGSVVKIAAGVETGKRLSSLGLVPGTEVRVIRRAPMGDPLELEVRGCRICLRAEQLHQVIVERVL